MTGPLSLAANLSRGFRAPDITDLGTFGLTGSGYEVSNREVEGLGASVGSTADATAVSTGRAVEVLAPETSLSYELTRALPLAPAQGRRDRVPDRRGRQRRQADADPAARRRRPVPGRRARHAPARHRRRVRERVHEPRSGPDELRRGPDPRPRGDPRRGALAAPSSSAGSSRGSTPRTARPACRRTSRAGRPPPTAGCGCASPRKAAGATGSSPTSTPRRGRTASRASTSATAGPAPRARARASRASSRTARGPAASSPPARTASRATPTTC